MNILIDPISGSPRWEATAQRIGPKEDFAREAAVRLLAGNVALEAIRDQIVEAANESVGLSDTSDRMFTLKDVKKRIGGSGPDWYFELQRVAEHPRLLRQLVENDGRGLTALSRKAGPIQAQRRKGFDEHSGRASVRDLIGVLEHLLSEVDDFPKSQQDRVMMVANSDSAKYRILRKDISGDRD